MRKGVSWRVLIRFFNQYGTLHWHYPSDQRKKSSSEKITKRKASKTSVENTKKRGLAHAMSRSRKNSQTTEDNNNTLISSFPRLPSSNSRGWLIIYSCHILGKNISVCHPHIACAWTFHATTHLLPIPRCTSNSQDPIFDRTRTQMLYDNMWRNRQNTVIIS